MMPCGEKPAVAARYVVLVGSQSIIGAAPGWLDACKDSPASL